VNIAQCKLIVKDYKDVIKNCDKALGFDPKNLKALYRRGNAKVSMGEYDSGREDLDQALELAPNNRAVKKARNHVKKLQRALRKKERKMYKNMFKRVRLVEDETEIYIDFT